MKKFKRIIAFILCIVACCVPALLMVGAAETSTCRHLHVALEVSNGTYVGYETVGTKDVCRNSLYNNVPVRCNDCHTYIGYENGVRFPISHPTLFYNENLGKYYCMACGYVQQ